MNVREINWLQLTGTGLVSRSGNVLTYTPVPPPPAESGVAPAVSFALAKSNLYFNEGTLKMRVRLGHPSSKVQFLLGHDTRQSVFAGLNAGAGAFGIMTWQDAAPGTSNRSASWGPGVVTGLPDSLPTDRDLVVELRVVGSSLTLLVDGIQVVVHTGEVQPSQLVLYFFGDAPCTAELVSAEKHEPVAFVVMQFTPEFDALFGDVIKPTCRRFGYAPVRADDIFNNGLIIEDISRSIREASLIIADITPKNPNVFYEVGFAHGIGKPTILMAERQLTSLPFDVAGFRTIFYDDSIGGKAKVEEKLAQHLQALTGRPLGA